MKLLVCGGRRYWNPAQMRRYLKQLAPELVIHGGAVGADGLAGAVAAEMKIPTSVFLADWLSYGRAAGPKRNQQMLDVGQPDAVLAFPGGRGTADMVRRAKAAGVRVIEVQGNFVGQPL